MLANLEQMQVTFLSAREIIQVKGSIPWVRGASGNVYTSSGLLLALWASFKYFRNTTLSHPQFAVLCLESMNCWTRASVKGSCIRSWSINLHDRPIHILTPWWNIIHILTEWQTKISNDFECWEIRPSSLNPRQHCYLGICLVSVAFDNLMMRRAGLSSQSVSLSEYFRETKTFFNCLFQSSGSKILCAINSIFDFQVQTANRAMSSHDMTCVDAFSVLPPLPAYLVLPTCTINTVLPTCTINTCNHNTMQL